ncbi:MAG: hypothetical protein R2824_02335 [Saprospiraceae bacterium]|nr:hypothetical protein [Lewinella sp.]
MTRDNFEFLKFQADRKYALEKRIFERRIAEKYEKLMSLGFHTASGRTAYQQQLETSREAELRTGLENLWQDIDAEFFGVGGMEGMEKLIPPVSSIIVLPAAASPTALSCPLESKKSE